MISDLARLAGFENLLEPSVCVLLPTEFEIRRFLDCSFCALSSKDLVRLNGCEIQHVLERSVCAESRMNWVRIIGSEIGHFLEPSVCACS